MSASHSYDLILFGATGFTGALTAQYLAKNAPVKMVWALAGRNIEKLEMLRGRLTTINPICERLALIQADVSDAAALRDLARSARVVVTTVGPYVHHGESLVAACAEAGTDYLDLTGEPEFVDRMWLEYHEMAKRTGARLVHCCGFDSIPHDLGAYFTVQQLPQEVPLSVKGYVSVSGEFSGGTFHSAMNAFGRLRETAKVARQRRAIEGWPIDRRIGTTRAAVHWHKRLETWVMPFPSIDPQVVRRSAAALDRYGPDFRYGHFIQVKTLKGLAALVGGVAALIAAAQFKRTRKWLLAKKTQGEGPSEARRAASWFRVRFHGSGGGRRVVTEVSGGDPGYGETSKMLAESALCLAFDTLPKRAGQLTPAVAMGDALIARLQRAGILFKLIETS